MSFSSPCRLGRLQTILLAALLAIAAFALLAGPATAAPLTNVLTLTELQTKLDAAGPSGINGTMKTTFKGTAIADVDVRVLAVVPSIYPWGKLILLESDDARITRIGGVAGGMSGSPIFVDDGGTQKLIGAISWGEANSLNGSIMATPIEYMMNLEAGDYTLRATRSAAPRTTVALERPVHTNAGTVSSIAFAKNTAAATGATKRGELVMRPLMLFQIAGASPESAAYKKIAARLTGLGGTVVAASSSPRKAGPVPALEAGSPCGVTFSEGDLVIGAFGTVTYVNGQNVLAFGHPIFTTFFGPSFGAGPLQGTLVGAVVDGITPSSATPNKIMSLADTKGVATQDRSAGVLCHLAAAGAATYPVRVDTTVTGDGAPRQLTSTVNIGRWYSQAFDIDGDSLGAIVSLGFSRVLATTLPSGHATTKTDVAFTDGTKQYTITRNGLWAANGNPERDTVFILSNLLKDPDGVRSSTLKIESVDVKATFAPEVKTARLAGIKLPQALHEGDNPLEITYYSWGSPARKTLTTTLTLPAGAPLCGNLSVLSAEAASEGEGDGENDPAAPETIEQLKERLEAAPSQDTLTVVFAPGDAGDATSVVRTTVTTGLLFTGGIGSATETVTLNAPAAVGYGSSISVRGEVANTERDVSVSLYTHRVGEPLPSSPAKVVTARAGGGSARFTASLPAGAHTTVVTAVVGASSSKTLPGAAQRTVGVRAALSLKAARSGSSTVCTANVTPKDTGGAVRFQRLAGKKWVTFATVPVASNGVARTTLTNAKPSKVRAQFTGSALNAAGAWVTVSVR